MEEVMNLKKARAEVLRRYNIKEYTSEKPFMLRHYCIRIIRKVTYSITYAGIGAFLNDRKSICIIRIQICLGM